MKKIISYSKLYIEFTTKVIEIDGLTIFEQLSEHGVAKTEMLVMSDREFRFIDELSKDTNVKIVLVENDEPKVIFIGVMSNITAKKIDKVYNVTLTMKSKSFSMDLKIKRRSFQNKDNPYEKLFNKIVEEDNGGSVFDNASKGKTQEESIIQYDETDWIFTKRLASKLGAKIIVDVTSEYPALCIGKQVGNDFEQITHAFSVDEKVGEFVQAKFNYPNWNAEEEKIFFDIKSVNDFKISDNVIYEKIRFKVFAKETFLEKGFVIFKYSLVKESGFKENLIVNPKILGASIDGKILDIKVDRVKIHLSIDEKQPIDEAYWYKWETSYTSEGQTGFYSMPQKGDNVKLYTPTHHIEDGFVRTVNRLDGKTNCKIKKPDVKYFGNIDKKELMLAPNEFQVTARNGYILLNMDDEKGIEITSSYDLIIKTQETAEVTGKRIALRSSEEILLATKSSCIFLVEDLINLKAEGGVNL